MPFPPAAAVVRSYSNARAEATGVKIIATSGFHTDPYYEADHWARAATHDQLVALLLHECAVGIDAHDREPTPDHERTGVRPGLLKVATGYWAARPQERQWLRVVAEVHRAHGASCTDPHGARHLRARAAGPPK